MLERNDRQLDAVTELHEQLAARHGITFRRPPREILRAITAMARGLGLERQLAPGAHLETMFEDYAVALMLAFIGKEDDMTATLAAADRLRMLAAEQIARDGWSRDQLLAHQQERLGALLAHAREHSPYYRDVLATPTPTSRAWRRSRRPR